MGRCISVLALHPGPRRADAIASCRARRWAADRQPHTLYATTGSLSQRMYDACLASAALRESAATPGEEAASSGNDAQIHGPAASRARAEPAYPGPSVCSPTSVAAASIVSSKGTYCRSRHAPLVCLTCSGEVCTVCSNPFPIINSPRNRLDAPWLPPVACASEDSTHTLGTILPEPSRRHRPGKHLRTIAGTGGGVRLCASG